MCGVVWGKFQVAAAVACKAGISAMLALSPLYTEELFPSNLQSAVLQACKLVSYPCIYSQRRSALFLEPGIVCVAGCRSREPDPSPDVHHWGNITSLLSPKRSGLAY